MRTRKRRRKCPWRRRSRRRNPARRTRKNSADFWNRLTRRSLKRQIADLEQTLVQPRSWELQGETTAASRGENELLGVDLDVDRVGVTAPVSTVESTLSLEDMIKVAVAWAGEA